LIDRVGFSILHLTFKMTSMTSFHTTKCCHLVSENEASAGAYTAAFISSWSIILPCSLCIELQLHVIWVYLLISIWLLLLLYTVFVHYLESSCASLEYKFVLGLHTVSNLTYILLTDILQITDRSCTLPYKSQDIHVISVIFN